jgi:cephalosporin-C deacetylase-like acetyl esterase
LIYHQGHENELDLSRPVVEFFLAKGYRVLTLCMPLFCENNISTVELPRFGLMQINNHDKMAFLDRPFHYFFEPITLCLNYIEKQYKPSLISMTGLSGGGWTTTVYAAIDSRIKYSFPVAGSLPISLRQSRDWGDFEQTYPSLYEIANYYELYTIGASNGKQVQILNKFDSCCFALDNIPGYVKEVDKKARLFFGTFSFYLDDSHHEHTLSSSAMKVIEENLP